MRTDRRSCETSSKAPRASMAEKLMIFHCSDSQKAICKKFFIPLHCKPYEARVQVVYEACRAWCVSSAEGTLLKKCAALAVVTLDQGCGLQRPIGQERGLFTVLHMCTIDPFPPPGDSACPTAERAIARPYMGSVCGRQSHKGPVGCNMYVRIEVDTQSNR